MNNEKQHSPKHETMLKKQALEQSEIKEVLVFIQKYVKPAAIVIAAVCAVFLVERFIKANRNKRAIAADSAFAKAESATDYQAILDNYKSTPYAPFAMMGLAMENFNAGQIDIAESLYSRFLRKYGEHELAAQAELNMISCKEARGQTSEAQTLYGEFSKKHEDSHLVPLALLNQARCMESQGKFTDAKQVYEDIIAYHTDSEWAQTASINLKMLKGKLK